MLTQDKELEEQHRLLVDGGSISDGEFWESRLELVRMHRRDIEIQNRMVAANGFPPLVKLGSRFTFDANTIRSILCHYPDIHSAYMEVVPHRLSEKEFWSSFAAYVRAINSAAAGGAAPGGEGEKVLAQELRRFREDEECHRLKVRQARKVDEEFDLGRTAEDAPTGVRGELGARTEPLEPPQRLIPILRLRVAPPLGRAHAPGPCGVWRCVA